MRLNRLIVLLLLAAWPAASMAVPAVLIVQTRVKATRDQDPNVQVGDALSQELDDDGRVLPILWSQTDPLFRAAVADGLIRYSGENPSLDIVFAAAGKLKAEYVLIIQAVQTESGIATKAQLYRNKGLIWIDPPKGGADDIDARNRRAAEKMAQRGGVEVQDETTKIEKGVRLFTLMSLSQFSEENSSQTVARTYAHLLAGEPFKNLTPKPRTETPEPEKGEKPILQDPPPLPAVDNTKVFAQADDLLRKGDPEAAIALMRDSVDAAPFDVDRRKKLAEAFMASGHPDAAALESRRAAELAGSPALRVVAVEAWITAGKLDEAKRDLDEVLVRSPQDPKVQTLRGQLLLFAGDDRQALGVLDAAVAATDADGLFWRSAAKAFAGDMSGSKADLVASDKLVPLSDEAVSAPRYRLLFAIAAARLATQGEAIKALIPQARLNRTATSIMESTRGMMPATDGLASLLQASPPPARHKFSHERLVLALKLLSQSMSDLQSYSKDGDEVSLSDATINLGEALKALALARELYQRE